MTNKDKFLKEGAIESDFSDLLTEYILNNSNNVRQAIYDFFAKQVKPTLTEDERVILSNIKNEEYNGIIGRENDITYQEGKLYLRNKYSNAKAFAFSTLYNHLFQFIKERRRIRNSRTIERRINNVISSYNYGNYLCDNALCRKKI